MEKLVIAQRIGEEDIENIAKLVTITEAFDKHKALGDHTWLDLVHGGRKGVYGFTARYKASAQLVGYAQVSLGNDTWALELVIHPSERRPERNVAKSLLKRSMDEIATHGGGHVHVWLAKHGGELEAVLNNCGFTQGRSLIQMRRPLPLEKDLALADIETKPFQPGTDEDEWLLVNNLAFANHPEQGGWSRATLAQRQAEPWFDPEGFLLHFIEGELAGFCWTKIHSDVQPELGEIYVIGVHPKYSGTGLGRRICISGLNYLSSKSLPIAMLYVDSNNDRATAMYEHLGFHPDHVDLAFIADIQSDLDQNSLLPKP